MVCEYKWSIIVLDALKLCRKSISEKNKSNTKTTFLSGCVRLKSFSLQNKLFIDVK